MSAAPSQHAAVSGMDVNALTRKPVVRASDTGLAILLEPPDPKLVKFRSLFQQPTGQAVIHFMQQVQKVSSKNAKAPRVLLLSNAAVYLTDLNTSVKRCLPVGDIESVVWVPETSLIAFRVPSQYDLLLELPRGGDPHYLLNILRVLYQKEHGFDQRALRNWVITLPVPVRRPKDFSPPLQMKKPPAFVVTSLVIPVLTPHDIAKLIDAQQQQRALPDLQAMLSQKKRVPSSSRTATPPPRVPAPGQSSVRTLTPEQVKEQHPLLMRNTTEVPAASPAVSPTRVTRVRVSPRRATPSPAGTPPRTGRLRSPRRRPESPRRTSPPRTKRTPVKKPRTAPPRDTSPASLSRPSHPPQRAKETVDSTTQCEDAVAVHRFEDVGVDTADRPAAPGSARTEASSNTQVPPPNDMFIHPPEGESDDEFDHYPVRPLTAPPPQGLQPPRSRSPQQPQLQPGYPSAQDLALLTPSEEYLVRMQRSAVPRPGGHQPPPPTGVAHAKPPTRPASPSSLLAPSLLTPSHAAAAHLHTGPAVPVPPVVHAPPPPPDASLISGGGSSFMNYPQESVLCAPAVIPQPVSPHGMVGMPPPSHPDPATNTAAQPGAYLPQLPQGMGQQGLPLSGLPSPRESHGLVQKLESDMIALQREMQMIALEKDAEIMALRRQVEASNAPQAGRGSPPPGTVAPREVPYPQAQAAPSMASILQPSNAAAVPPQGTGVDIDDLLAPTPGVRVRGKPVGPDVDAVLNKPPPQATPPLEPRAASSPAKDSPKLPPSAAAAALQPERQSLARDEELYKKLTDAQVRSIETRRLQIEEVQQEVKAMVDSGRYHDHSPEIVELRAQLDSLIKDLKYEAKGYELSLMLDSQNHSVDDDLQLAELAGESPGRSGVGTRSASPQRARSASTLARGDAPPVGYAQVAYPNGAPHAAGAAYGASVPYPPAAATGYYGQGTQDQPQTAQEYQEALNQYYQQYYQYYYPYYVQQQQQQQQYADDDAVESAAGTHAYSGYPAQYGAGQAGYYGAHGYPPNMYPTAMVGNGQPKSPRLARSTTPSPRAGGYTRHTKRSASPTRARGAAGGMWAPPPVATYGRTATPTGRRGRRAASGSRGTSPSSTGFPRHVLR